MKPVLWIHKSSGRIRFNGDGLPESWMPLYSKEDLELTPARYENPKDLNDKAKRVWEYIRDRKLPFEAKNIATHFAITSGSIAKHLTTLHAAGLLSKARKANKVLWTVKHEKSIKEPVEFKQTTVAVPEQTVETRTPSVVWPTNPYKTSYPHVRGYDD